MWIATTRRLLRYARPHRAQLAGGLVVALVGVLFELARPWPIKIVIDGALGGASLPSAVTGIRGVLPGAATRDGLIAWAVAASVVIAISSAALSVLAVKITLKVAFEMVTSLANDVFIRLQGLSLSYHQRHAVGDLLQ